MMRVTEWCASGRCLVMLVAVAAWSVAATAETPADRWNLADIYPSVAAWNADAAKLDAQLSEFSGCKGHLGDAVARFRLCIDLRSDMTKRYYRLASFAAEQLAEDTGSPASLELDQRADGLGARLKEAAAFFDPEILRIGKERVARFLQDDPTLAIYRFPLEQTLRAAPHTLSDEGEALVANFAAMNHAGGSAYSILTNADLPWPTVKLASGEEVRLDATEYMKRREAPNRDDRKRVMDAYSGTFGKYERTLGVMLNSQLKQDAVYSKVRKYPDTISRVLDRDRVPVVVFDTLIGEAQANLPTLHRYFRLRAKIMGLTQLQYYDLYPPLVQGDFAFPLARARELLLQSVTPLGDDYLAALARGLDQRWMDVYPRPRKQPSAHMSDDAYDVHPYVLMNYTDDYESVTTLAHEWGHAMHSVLAKGAQPYATFNYAVFVAEIASTFNEQLLADQMQRTARSDDERLYYLGSALEDIRGTYFRKAMLAEFERDIHARADKGEPLTGEALTHRYCEILKRHHGTRDGIVAIDDAYCVEWAYVAQLYSPFYVYQYATSLAASALFAQRVRSGEPGARKSYLDLLRAGGSDHPYELVKAAGVDLATPAPYRALMARMNRIMDEIEAILAKRK